MNRPVSIGCFRVELIARDLTVHINDWDAFLVEYAGPVIGVEHLDQGLAADIAIDGEGVGDGAWFSQESIDAKGRFPPKPMPRVNPRGAGG